MISEKVIKAFGYDYKTFEDYINNFKPVDELKWIYDSENHRVITELKEEQKEQFDYGYYILREVKPDLNISYKDFAENKITIGKQKRKLFKYINDQKLSEEVGKYKLPNKKLYLVYSLNPEDFLMMATCNPWTACTNLNGGDFRYTVISNLFMKGRFMTYITDLEETEYLGLKSLKKFFRAMGFINRKGELITNIWYPIKEYLKLNDGKSLSVTETEDKISKYSFDKVYNNFGFFVYPYLDYSTINEKEEIKFENKYYRYDPYILFKNGNKVGYTEVIKYSPDELNLENDLWKFCDCCGSKKDITTLGDKNYCSGCLEKELRKCDYCGNEFSLKDLKFTEDNKFICPTCVETKYNNSDRICSCGTLIRKEGENQCRFCRSGRVDSFKNVDFAYFYKNNLYTYFKHHYIKDYDELPPGIKYDENIWETYEKYTKRENVRKH